MHGTMCYFRDFCTCHLWSHQASLLVATSKDCSRLTPNAAITVDSPNMKSWRTRLEIHFHFFILTGIVPEIKFIFCGAEVSRQSRSFGHWPRRGRHLLHDQVFWISRQSVVIRVHWKQSATITTLSKSENKGIIICLSCFRPLLRWPQWQRRMPLMAPSWFHIFGTRHWFPNLVGGWLDSSFLAVALILLWPTAVLPYLLPHHQPYGAPTT